MFQSMRHLIIEKVFRQGLVSQCWYCLADQGLCGVFDVLAHAFIGRRCTRNVRADFFERKNLEQIRGKIREKIRETIYRAAHAKNSAESSLPSQPTLVLYPN